ncbi:glycine/D-amino acid oxidase-like deaminating enzyme [Methylovirgula ligni]|uniref:Glycine/D-amino acid oxidase-like deaminating enzyme n=1 Tax=Methylovirgula ligni TaxID=569860 RepID=A0A3D9YVH1_9HYPH|nr:FAD-binding oxidoreductase [Methylovirgula ligni]REF86525.1 glycine/D-amino acid oxidase-like deaminating enzyme [Methylovirgula ligni]
MTPDRADVPTLRELAGGRWRKAIGNIPYWWEAAPPENGKDTPLPQKVDVVIAGSGFTGLSAALTLAREGRRVVVVDAGVPGFGASTRNGGQVGSGNQKFRVKTLIAMKGERKAVELLHEGVEMLDGIERLIQREHIDCDFTRCGRFRGAMRPEHYEAMARDMKDLRRYADVESEMIPRAEQRKEIGTDLFYGGSLLPQDASLHPGRYHAGLLARVRDVGGLVRANAAVKDIVSEKNRHLVRFDGFDVEARDVIVATNGYTKNVGPFFAKRIVPVVSAQIATGPIPPELFDTLFPKRRVFGNSNRVFFYFRPAPGEYRLIWGGRSSHIARRGSAAAYAHLASDLLRAFPELGEIKLSHAWDGTIGYTFDEFPHLGRTVDGIHYAMGYCGTGVSRATHFGRKIALQLLGKPEGESAFSDLSFPSHPLHFAAKRAVPLIETWYRLRDTGNF